MKKPTKLKPVNFVKRNFTKIYNVNVTLNSGGTVDNSKVGVFYSLIFNPGEFFQCQRLFCSWSVNSINAAPYFNMNLAGSNIDFVDSVPGTISAANQSIYAQQMSPGYPTVHLGKLTPTYFSYLFRPKDTLQFEIFSNPASALENKVNITLIGICRLDIV